MKNAESEKSTIRVIVHSFFVVPFLIAAFGVLIFFIWSLLTYESKSIEEYIVDIKVGGATKRWQSAYELSRLLNDKDQTIAILASIFQLKERTVFVKLSSSATGVNEIENDFLKFCNSLRQTS